MHSAHSGTLSKATAMLASRLLDSSASLAAMSLDNEYTEIASTA